MASRIVAKQLEKRFGHIHAVQGINLEVPAGQVLGFLGPNGAGKSTTMRMIVESVVSTKHRAMMWTSAPDNDSTSSLRRPTLFSTKMENWRTGPRSGCWESSAAIDPYYAISKPFLQPHLRQVPKVGLTCIFISRYEDT